MKKPSYQELERKYRAEKYFGWTVFVIAIIFIIFFLLYENRTETLLKENLDLKEQINSFQEIPEICNKTTRYINNGNETLKLTKINGSSINPPLILKPNESFQLNQVEPCKVFP